MGISVTALRNKLTQGGARPSLFYAKLNLPAEGPVTDNILRGTGLSNTDISFFIKAAQIPESAVASVPINFLGREFKVPSIDRTFPDWTVTVINDEDFKIRHIFESWIEFMAPGKAIFDTPAAFGENSSIFGDLEVHQLTKQGGAANSQVNGGIWTGSYYFIDAFPTNVSSIDLSWDNKDTIEEFSVTFSYQYWEKRVSVPPSDNPFLPTTTGVDSAVNWATNTPT